MPAYESTEEYLNSTQIGRQIIRIRENVSDALTAIGAKGVTVPSGANSDDLATLIAAIETGGGGGGTTRTVVIPEQTIIADTTYNPITNFAEPLELGEQYVYTINGVEHTAYGVDLYGSVAIHSDNTPCYFEYDRGMYFTVNNSADYDTYTVKVEKIVESSSGGSGGGEGSSTLIAKTITANGTYNASDDDADGYSSVTVNVPSGSSKNVQTAQSTDRRNNTALGSVASLTCDVAGTYDVYWTCARSNTSQTWGSQLYINGTAYGTENTTWDNNVQVNHLEDVVIPANATVAVYGRSRSGYYIYVPQLTIVQTA